MYWPWLQHSRNERVILQKHDCRLDAANEFLDALVPELGKEKNNSETLARFKKTPVYKGRSKEGSESGMGVMASQVCFYMLAYRPLKDNSSDRGWRFTQTTKNLYVSEAYAKEKERGSISQNSLVNLFSLSFPSHYSRTPKTFSLNFGRVLIQLLVDERLGRTLYASEWVYFLPFVKRVDHSFEYERLVEAIISFRSRTFEEKNLLFDEVHEKDSIFSNCTHEMGYFWKIFTERKVFISVPSPSVNEEKYVFTHVKRSSTKTATTRTLHGFRGISLNPFLLPNATALLASFPCWGSKFTFSSTVSLTTNESLEATYQENMRNFLEVVLPVQKWSDHFYSKTAEMLDASVVSEKNGREFEKSVLTVLKLFHDLKSEMASGPGRTDVECAWETKDGKRMLFNVECKSGGSSKNFDTGSIEKHLKDNKAEFCLVIGRSFSKNIYQKIEGKKIVCLSASNLCEYVETNATLYKEHLSFSNLYEIFFNNLGTEVLLKQ